MPGGAGLAAPRGHRLGSQEVTPSQPLVLRDPRVSFTEAPTPWEPGTAGSVGTPCLRGQLPCASVSVCKIRTRKRSIR